MSLDDFIQSNEKNDYRVLNIKGNKIITSDKPNSYFYGYYLIRIREPFYKAREYFKWDYRKANGYGIGINEDLVRKAIFDKKQLMIILGSNYNVNYTADPLKVRTFCSETHSVYKANNTLLYVYPEILCVVRKYNLTYLEGVL